METSDSETAGFGTDEYDFGAGSPGRGGRGHSGNVERREDGINNSHLAGPRPVGQSTPRLWTGWYAPRLPLHLLESDVVVDSNAQRQRVIELRGGGKRTWGLRDLTPAQHKQDQLRDYYASLEESVKSQGVLTPLLVWRSPDLKFYLRYGASRVHVARRLGLDTIPAVICDYSEPKGNAATPCNDPLSVMMAFGPPASVGWLEVSHERIDAHHIEPRYPTSP